MRPRLALLLFCALTLTAQERTVATPAAAGFRIGGVAVNALNHLPLAQARVTITLASDSQYTRTVTTAADGRFQFDRLKAGKYALSAERRGFTLQMYKQHEGYSTAIVAGPDLEAAELVFAMAPDASFSGRIIDERGDSVRHAQVMVIGEELREGVRARHIVAEDSTDDQGYYHAGHLRPGAYYLAVSARPWYAQTAMPPRMDLGEGASRMAAAAPRNPALDVAYPLTFYPQATDAAAATPITLHAGDRASADVMLRAVPALHVRINNAGGEEPQRAINVSLAQPIFDTIQIPVESRNQHIGPNIAILAGIAPGHYLLRLNANPQTFGPRQRVQPGAESWQPMRVRELDLLGDTELDANESAPAAAVSGSVKPADSQTLPRGIMVELRSRGGLSLLAPTNASGEFVFPRGVPAGSYEVMMSSGEGLFIRGITANGARIPGRTLLIGGSDAVKLSLVASAGMGRVEGVALRDGKPQAGAMILLVPHDAANNQPLFRRDQSGSDGTFTLMTVIPGRYTVLALDHGWEMEWSQPGVLKPYLAGGTSVIVEANGKHKVGVNVQ